MLLNMLRCADPLVHPRDEELSTSKWRQCQGRETLSCSSKGFLVRRKKLDIKEDLGETAEYLEEKMRRGLAQLKGGQHIARLLPSSVLFEKHDTECQLREKLTNT